MTYRIELSHAAARQLRMLDGSARRRVQAAIELLAQGPRPAGAKKLVSGRGEWRVRPATSASSTRSMTGCW